MARPIQFGGDRFIRCSFCPKPAVYLFWERTDGRNGFVCEDHFGEENLLLTTPDHDRTWERNVAYLDSTAGG